MLNKKVATGVLLILVLAAAVSACGRPGASADLDGTGWKLTSLNGRIPLAGADVTIAFRDGEVSGSAGCNSYFGSYAVQGADGLRFPTIANTEMACLEPAGIMEQETEYLTTLREATRFHLSDGQLEIFTAGGGVLVYSPAQ
jgi:heat shock protein HslJ